MIHRIVCGITILALLSLSFGCEANGKNSGKPLSLGYFKNISNIAISDDGNQLLFCANGHKEFRDETVYRYELNSRRLFRYIPKDRTFLAGGRFVPGSSRFVFEVIPYDANDKNVYDDMQIAIANLDGSGYRMLTRGKGVKLHPAISSDGMTLVYFKGALLESGSPLRRQKQKAGRLDLFKVDLSTAIESQLTRLEFYDVSDPYFSLDDKGVVFSFLAIMRLPYTKHVEDVWRFQKSYTNDYADNRIIRYQLDASGVNKSPVPLFTFNSGSEDPVLAGNESVWFEGRVGEAGWIRYCQKFSTGKIMEIDFCSIGLAPGNGRFMYKFVVNSQNNKFAALTWNQNTEEKFITIFDIKTKESFDVRIPSKIYNINIK